MTIAEDRLLAYVDGRLPADETAEIERALESDAEARDLVTALRASDLPYREAAETLLAAPDLSDLERMIADAPRRPSRAGLPRWLPVAAAIAVFFAAGLIAGRYVLPPPQSPQTPQTQWARWLDDIATYQALFTRETLAFPNPPAARRTRQMAKVSAALGQPLAAPDLAAEGADYKYAWLYAIDGQPLAQIAYQPKTGKPFSLCLMRTDLADHEPRYAVKHGMQMATWRDHGIAWVFVGDVSRGEMNRYIAAARARAHS